MSGEGRAAFAPFRALRGAFEHEGVFELSRKFLRALREEGVGPAFARMRIYRKRLNDEHYVEVADPGDDRDVLFVSACPGGTRRYRCAHVCESLAAIGLRGDVLCFPVRSPDAWLRSSRAVVLQRVPIDSKIRALCAEARALGIRTVFDLDDLLFDPEHVDQLDSSIYAKPFERDWAREHATRIGDALELCDVVTVSTAALRDAVLERFEGARVHVLPNLVSQQMVEDFGAAAAVPDEPGEGLSIGFFSGTPTHDDAFAAVAPALAHVLTLRPHVTVTVTGPVCVPELLEPFAGRVRATPLVALDEYPRALRAADIHLAPLRDTAFDASKSALKWLEAALVRRPIVASAHGAYADAIEDGRTGLLAATHDEWCASLLRLVDDAILRERLSLEAERAVLETRTTAKYGALWRDVLLRDPEHADVRDERIVHPAPEMRRSVAE